MPPGLYPPGYVQPAPTAPDPTSTLPPAPPMYGPGVPGTGPSEMNLFPSPLVDVKSPGSAPAPQQEHGVDPLDALQARLVAGAAQRAGGGTGSSSTTIRQGRPEDAAMLAGLRSDSEAMAGSARTAQEEQHGLNLKYDAVLKDYLTEAKEAKTRYGAAGAEMQADYRQAAIDLRTARDDLKSMNVNATRLWDTMPTAQRVMMAIGNLFGSAAEAASDGKIANSVGKWWSQAVEKDIDMQREAIKRKMSEVELSTKERDSLWKKWTDAEEQIRTGATAAAKLELAQMNLASDDVTQKREMAKSIYALGGERRAAEHGEFTAKQDQKTTTKSYTSGGASAGASGAVDPKTAANQIEAYKAAKKVRQLIDDNGGAVPRYGRASSEYEHALSRYRLFQAKSEGATGRALGATIKAESATDPSSGLMSWVKNKVGISGADSVAAHSAEEMERDAARAVSATVATAMSGAKAKKGKR